MKRLTVPLMVIGALGLSSTAFAADDPSIFSPTDGEKIYVNTLGLVATDSAAAEGNVQWAMRRFDGGTCDKGDDDINNVFGNVDGMNNAYTWENGVFGATFDITGFPSGEYCFVLNATTSGGIRQLSVFYIVDDYAKVSGVIGRGEAGRGRSGTHTFEGVLYTMYGQTFGMVSVNYRMLGTTCVFEPGSLVASGNDPGIALNGLRGNATGLSGVCTDGGTTSNASIFLLDRGAESNRDAPRGAIVVRWNGTPGNGVYEIDGTPGSTGVDSWISLETGNVHVKSR